jgi:hypothetical protein
MVAHAFGARYDSPVPLALFVLGGAVVVLLSFVVVYRREVANDPKTVLEDVIVPPRAGFGASTASVLVLALLVLAGLLGSQEVPENILPTTFWVMGWVAVPLSVGVLGDWTGPANPFAAISRAAGTPAVRRLVLGRTEPLGWSPRAAWWISAGGYALVVVGELIVNGVATLPRVTAVALVAYALMCAAGGVIVGADAWTSRGEIFTVMLATWGRLGWWRFRAPGRRGFAGGLVVPFEATPGRVVGVLLLLVSVSFDGLLSTPQWSRLTAALPSSWAPGSGGYEAFGTLAFATLTTCTLAVFGVFAVAAGRAAGHRLGILQALTGLLPSLLPIAFGYLLAHYLQYVLINGQLMLPLLGNPVGSANWPLHLPFPFNDSYEVATGIMPTSVVWYVQMAVIVVAHIVAVVLAHRHLAVSAPAAGQARRSEWPWLVAMVGYTMLSLWLLAQPLIEQPGSSGPS